MNMQHELEQNPKQEEKKKKKNKSVPSIHSYRENSETLRVKSRKTPITKKSNEKLWHLLLLSLFFNL